MALLEVQHIEKRFGTTQVLTDISFSLEKGQALSIIGSSGSGKTTLLSCSSTPRTLRLSWRMRFVRNGSILVWCSRASTSFLSTQL